MKNGHEENYDHGDRAVDIQTALGRSVEAGLAIYGSTDNWPTLRLDANAFVMCVCGKKRSQHKTGADASPYVPTKNGDRHECNQFTWAGGVIASRKDRRARRNAA